MPFDGAEDKAQELANSRPLDLHRWSNFPEVEQAVDAIYADLRTDPLFGGHERLQKKCIKVLILDLCANWLTDPTRFTSYSRDANHYRRGSRYNRLNISYGIVSVIDAMQRRNLLEHHIGFYDTESQVGRLSRMRATDRLIRIIKDEHGVSAEAIGHWQDRECIILRKRVRNKNVDKEYRDTANTRRMRANLILYNELLERTDITVPNAPPEGIPNMGQTMFVRPLPKDKFVRRIFNNKSWGQGGRFYGGWWQRIPSDWRVQISMNGSEGSTEIDYSGHHITLLYAKEGVDYWATDGRDTYEIPGIEPSERMRALLKIVLLIAINAQDRRAALSALRWKVSREPEEFDWVEKEDIHLAQIIDAFAERHGPIKRHFYSNAGVRLQRLDSDIAEEVINSFTADGIPVLCIHDSFVVQPEHAERLKEEMIYAIRRTTHRLCDGLEITPKLKKTLMHTD